MNQQNSRRALVLDGNQRSALAITRALGKIAGLSVLVADSTTSSLAGSSKYCHAYLQYPSPQTKAGDFVEWLETVTREQDIDILFPATEITSQLLLMHRARLAPCLLPFADLETVMRLAHKGDLMRLAAHCGVPYPQTQHFHNAAELEPDKVLYPAVIKPCLSHIWLPQTQSWLSTAVQIVRNPDDLKQCLKNTHYLHHHPFLLQHFIPGHGAGVFALYNHGKPLAFFAHERLREKPPRGGVSVLSRSVPLDPTLHILAEKLLTAASWHGVAMVEFRISPQGQPYLMEINTRFWGSLQLAIDAGVDFPALLYQLTFTEPIDYSGDYCHNIRLRWLLGDLDHLYLVLKPGSGYSFKQKIARLCRFLLPWRPGLHYEINRLSDLKPAWFELCRYLKRS